MSDSAEAIAAFEKLTELFDRHAMPEPSGRMIGEDGADKGLYWGEEAVHRMHAELVELREIAAVVAKLFGDKGRRRSLKRWMKHGRGLTYSIPFDAFAVEVLIKIGKKARKLSDE